MTEHSRTTVIKAGGQEVGPGSRSEGLVHWISAAHRSGARLLLVHGGGEEVTERAAALGLPTETVDGQRVTSAPMLEVVLEVLGGRVNGRLVSQLGAAGVPAVGISGLSDRVLTVRPSGKVPGSLGFVGDPTRVRTELLESLLDRGFVPVVAPLGSDGSGQPYNVNADLAAAAIARALDADLLIVTNVPGVIGSSGERIPRLSIAEARRLVAVGVARGGMVPKLLAAERALTPGSSVWIGDLGGLLGGRSDSGTRLRPGAREAAPARRRLVPPGPGG